MSLLYGYESTVVLCLAMFAGNGTGRFDQPPFRLILSAESSLAPRVTKTGPAQTV